MGFAPNPFTSRIYDFVENGRGDGAVNAVAGSGKTTTIIECANRVKSERVLFLAFNVAIVKELQNRLGANVNCMTLNGLGHRALMKHLHRKLTVRDKKYFEIADNAVRAWDTENVLGQKFGDVSKAVRTLTGFAMSSLKPTDDDSLMELATYYGVELPNGVIDPAAIFAMVRESLKVGEQLARQGIISFDDQIFMPVLWKVATVQKADFTFVDECQDLSAAKLALTLMTRAPGGRMIFVGDPRQSIYGFAGADAKSFENIVETTKATVLPLSVCYRCPKSVIEIAKEVVPEIEAAPDALPGVVGNLTEDKLAQNLRNGDLVLCRLTAPLIKLCIDLIRQRVPARVKGRDVGRMLVQIAKDALGKLPFDDLDMALDNYLATRLAVLQKRKHTEGQQEALQDRVDGVRACIDAFPECHSLADFEAAVNGLFTDGTAVVELSTVHKAKGLGADRVFVLKPKKLPLTWKGQQQWEAQQEQNLRYVAVTRAIRELYFVQEEADVAPPPAPAPAAIDNPVEAPAPVVETPAVEAPAPVVEAPASEPETNTTFAIRCYVCDARFMSKTRERVCRACGRRACQVKAIEAKLSDTPCDARCTNAVGHDCVCSCGGANHGKSYLTGYKLKEPATR